VFYVLLRTFAKSMEKKTAAAPAIHIEGAI
jgi:hypothetical protein